MYLGFFLISTLQTKMWTCKTISCIKNMFWNGNDMRASRAGGTRFESVILSCHANVAHTSFHLRAHNRATNLQVQFERKAPFCCLSDSRVMRKPFHLTLREWKTNTGNYLQMLFDSDPLCSSTWVSTVLKRKSAWGKLTTLELGAVLFWKQEGDWLSMFKDGVCVCL